MKLQDSLPQGVEVDGKFIKMDFDFRNVLNMIDVLDRKDMIPEAQAYKALCFVQKRPKNVFQTLAAVKGLLFPGTRKNDQKKVTDFVQDAGLIRAAFRQAYGIDLYREKLHWIEFTELLSAIPEMTKYSEVVGIRLRPMPEPTKFNQKERELLAKAKEAVKIELTAEEREEQVQRDIATMADFLLKLSEGSAKDG
ncbi:MAG: hypothetical protein IIZ93_01535 [Acidaminococcaceae bacterium]|nr:hypothetical protein [Acidaminococcaceae bacterium]